MSPTDPTDQARPVSRSEEIRSLLPQTPEGIGRIQTPDDVDNIAYEVLDNMPVAQELMIRIAKSRRAGKEDKDAVREQAKLFREVLVEVSLISGVEVEAVEHEGQRQVYKERLGAIIASVDSTASDEDILLSLGMIRPVEGERGHVFTFPSSILPPYVKEQWQSYIGMIEQSEVAAEKLKHGLITQMDFDGIDLLRTSAHDTVANSISEMLEFPDWDHERYRKLVEKMVEEKFAEPRGEVAEYARIFRGLSRHDEHLTTIHRTLGHGAIHPRDLDQAS